jgi:hypothetical protein
MNKLLKIKEFFSFCFSGLNKKRGNLNDLNVKSTFRYAPLKLDKRKRKR